MTLTLESVSGVKYVCCHWLSLIIFLNIHMKETIWYFFFLICIKDWNSLDIILIPSITLVAPKYTVAIHLTKTALKVLPEFQLVCLLPYNQYTLSTRCIDLHLTASLPSILHSERCTISKPPRLEINSSQDVCPLLFFDVKAIAIMHIILYNTAHQDPVVPHIMQWLTTEVGKRDMVLVSL